MLHIGYVLIGLSSFLMYNFIDGALDYGIIKTVILLIGLLMMFYFIGAGVMVSIQN